MYVSKVYHSELEDRVDARYYSPRYMDNIRHLKTLSKKDYFELKTLDDLYNKIKKGIFYILKTEYKKKGVPFIRVSNIKNFTIDMGDIVYISETLDKKESKTSLEYGDIVISKGGTIGKIALVPKWMPKCNISQDIIGVSLKKVEKAKSEYVAIFLMSNFGQLQMERVKTQQIQPHLTLGYMRDLKILIPLHYHDEIVSMIESAEEKNVAAFDKIEHAKTIFTDTLGIDTNSIKEEKAYKVSSNDLGEVFTPKFYYPKYLETVKLMKSKFNTIPLGEIAKIDRGDEVGSKNYKTFLNKEDGDVPFIRTSDIVNYEIDNYPDYYISEGIYKELNQDLRPQDILFTKDGKIGLAAMIVKSDKCIIASGIAKIGIKEEYKKDFDPYYVFLVLSTDVGMYQAFQRVVVASTIPHLQSERFGELVIPILPDDKQEEISNLVKEAFELKGEKKALIRKAKEKVEGMILG